MEPVARGLRFGSAAERYERFRPGYPDALVDLLLADGPVVSALEVGAGTGKATRAVAARGIAVTAVEPDPQMVAVLARETHGLPVTIVTSTFEAVGPRSPVDLVYAAAAWHWTDPATRWSRAAGLLREGGTFASFGSPVDLVDPALAEAVSAVRRDVGPDDTLEVAGDAMTWPGTELRATPLFTDARQDDLSVTRTVDADDFVGLLSTISFYLLMPRPERDEVLARIRALLPERVETRQELRLHRARRTGVHL